MLRVRAAVFVAVITVSVAACGSATAPATSSGVLASASADAGAGSTASPSAPTAAPAASSAGMTTADPNATPFPTFTRVPELESMVPKTFDGTGLRIVSMTGDDVLASGDPGSVAALRAILAATGKKPSDYGFAYAQVPGGSVVGVFRVQGADPSAVMDTLVGLAKTNAGGPTALDSGTIGGKKVRILRATIDGTEWSYYYWPKGDTLYYVQTADPTVAEKILSGL
jgi:hypothetical protein